MYGLVDIQRSIDDSAKQGIRNAAQLEQNREASNDALKAQDKINQKNSIAQGAGMGFMMGGPVGAVLGAGAGYLVHDFF
jgi:hypothetical protein|tara:strand:+ start:25290 stop:25526 length:237 start_codon:yes stop_codon:yes gene_type:complete